MGKEGGSVVAAIKTRRARWRETADIERKG